MKPGFIKLVFYVLAIVISLYFIFSTIPSFFTDNISGQVVVVGSYEECVTLEGIALRDERLLSASSAFSSIRYLVGSGDRVAKDSTYAIASRVSSDDRLYIQSVKLERKISELEESINNSAQYDIVTTEDLIKSEIEVMMSAADEMNFKTCDSASSSVQTALNRRQIKFFGASYYEKTLRDFSAQLKTLTDANESRTSSLKAPMAGYFYSGYDGYEYLRFDDYIDLTVADYYALISKKPQEIPANYVGKMQNEPVWKFYAVLDSIYASNLSVGQNVQLEFDIDLVGTKKLNANVEYISKEDSGKVAVTFLFNTMNGDLYSLRKETCKLVINTYSGFQVDRSAIRVLENGEYGVYVLSGQRIVFKPVNILYSTDNTSIVTAKATSGSRVLTNKDTVVVGGKSLYDGKVLNISD